MRNNININKINLIGLGKLGACMAVCFADAGFKILGYDINEDTVSTLKKYKSHIVEKDFQKYLSRSKKNLNFTTNIDDLSSHSSLSFIIVPTPSLKDNSFDNSYLIDSLKKLCLSLKKNKVKQHHFFINSTVMPGSCKKIFIPLIEKYSGLKFMKNFTLSYNPEFIALGSVIKNFLNPDFLLIGKTSNVDTGILTSIYNKVCKNKPRFCDMSLTSAEITKISLNSYITMKISFANMLSNISDNFDDVSSADIANALGSDKRVSPYYINPGLPFAGPCFPRDNKAFNKFLNSIKVNCYLPRETDKYNDNYNNYLVNKVITILKKNENKNIKTIGLYGVSFKKGTNVVEKSISIELINKLKSKFKIIIFDEAFDINYLGYEVVNDLRKFNKQSDLVLINHLENDLFLKSKFKNNYLNLWKF